jgi:hypothetical protein
MPASHKHLVWRHHHSLDHDYPASTTELGTAAISFDAACTADIVVVIVIFALEIDVAPRPASLAVTTSFVEEGSCIRLNRTSLTVQFKCVYGNNDPATSSRPFVFGISDRAALSGNVCQIRRHIVATICNATAALIGPTLSNKRRTTLRSRAKSVQ